MVLTGNFTQAFQVTDQVRYNISYLIPSQGFQTTTPMIYSLIVVLGIALFIVSVLGQEGDLHQDLAGIMATPLLLLAAIWSFSIDTVTSYGVVSQTGTYVSMEQHVLYHYDGMGIILAILFVLSIANLYRLWLAYNKVVQPSLPTADSPQMNAPQIPWHNTPNRPDTPNRPSKSYNDYNYKNKDRDDE